MTCMGPSIGPVGRGAVLLGHENAGVTVRRRVGPARTPESRLGSRLSRVDSGLGIHVGIIIANWHDHRGYAIGPGTLRLASYVRL